MTAPLDAFLSLLHAIDWLDLKARTTKAALQRLLRRSVRRSVRRSRSASEPRKCDGTDRRRAAFRRFCATARALIAEERFLNWQVAFPGVWRIGKPTDLTGGFDAIIGNPPWDRMKLQQVEWFAARRREIALAQRAADRKRMIEALERTATIRLPRDYAKANERAEAAARMARTGGDYPLLSGGDVNIYSLFVERAMTLVKPDGMVGLSYALRHRLGQDRVEVLQGRIDAGPAQGAL